MKHTNIDGLNYVTGTITIEVYEDSFEVKTSKNMDMFTIYLVAAGILDYLQGLVETLDKPEGTTFH